MNEFYLFKKAGFKSRQSIKLKDANKRQSILVDVDIANDSKIMMLHSQKDYTLGFTYLHILGKLDLEKESWIVRKDEFENWFRKTFGVNNSFKIEKRLRWLSDAGLIEFRLLSDDVQMTSRLSSDDLQTLELIASEPAEKQEYPEKDAPYIREEKVNEAKQSNSTPRLLTKFQPVMILKSKITGDVVKEEDWIFRGAVKKLQSGRGRVNLACDDLANFCGLNPEGKKMVYTWLSHEPAKRMAAAAYAMNRPNTVNEFDYALGALEQGWEGYEKYLPISLEAANKEDYEVNV